MNPVSKAILMILAHQVISGPVTALPAFPGAEGFGSIATGGRGGDVYYVTNLKASGAGSFAEGVATAPPQGRTILFKVSGHIRLPSGSGGGLTISKDRITIAGQTAPGDGICFWNNTMNITGDDLVLRNIRWRYGKQTAGGDSVDINGSQRIIFDHCDLMFSTDENLSSFGTAPEHLTFQWSTNAWGLQSHSAGGLWKMKHATVHHSLWANNHTRNPKLIGCDVFDWVNNLTFGWDLGFNLAPEVSGGSGYIHRVNIRNSTFSHGGSTSSCIYGGGLNDDGSTKFKLHMADTALDGNNNGILDVSRTNYQMVSATGYSQIATAWPQTDDGNPANPVVGTPVTTSPRLTAYKRILSKTGSVRMEIGPRPLRDEITALCVGRAAALQRNIISDPLELGLSTGTAFAQLLSDPAPADTDLDGMPDDWEDAVGYNRTSADNNTVLTAPETAASFFPAGSPAGYTRLEEYLHFKAVPHGTVPKNAADSPSSVAIDLRKFTSGFTASPDFTLSGIAGGTAVQSGPGNAIVTFTPTRDFSGRAGFHFTVTDATGDSWTQQCCLLVSTFTLPRPVTWTGDGVTNAWNATTPNFTSTLGITTFSNGDDVTIDDTGSHAPNLQIQGDLQPAAVTVSNNSKNFNLTGTGSLTGGGSLTKRGTGSLTITNTGPNGFASAALEGGTLSLASASSLGSAPIAFTGGTLAFSANIANPLAIDGSVSLNPGGSRELNSTWTGSGTVQINNTGTNLLTLGGGMTGFSGHVTFAASTGSARLSGSTGSGSAAFDLGSGSMTLFSRNGGAFHLGSLVGGSNTVLSGTSSTATVSTYTIGALGTSTTFAGRITNGGQAASSVIKTGSGTLTLAGNNNTYTGATHINSGSLEINGLLGASPVTIAANAVLSGNGTLGGSVTASAGGIISPGAANGSATGTLTTASLSLTEPTLRFDLSANQASGNDILTTSAAGPITLTGLQNFAITRTDGDLSPGTYELISTSGPLTASNVTFSSDLPDDTRQSFWFTRNASGASPGFVRLNVSGTTADLVWTGSGGGIWDRETTAAWSGATPPTFFNSDRVTFNDSASSGAVSIAQPVAPGAITVTNSTLPYTFGGAPITGSTSLVKSGSGTLTLNLPQHRLANSSTIAGNASVMVSSTTGLFPGMTVTGPGIADGTSIASVDGGSTVTLSQAATATSSTATLIFETRNTYSGGTFLNGGSLVLTSNASPLADPYAPANPYGLGTGPVTFNGGSLTLHGHLGNLASIFGALPNDLIVPAGQTGHLFDTVRGVNSAPFPSLTGSLTGSGTLNLTVNYYRSAITGDWSGFSGILNVKRPVSGASDPRIQFGGTTGLPLATVNLEQVRLEYTATPPAGGITIPIGSLSGIGTSAISGSQNAAGTVIWQIGGLDASTTFAGSFTPYLSYPIGLEKTGAGTFTLTGSGTLDAGITVAAGTLSCGDSASDSFGSIGALIVNPGATLQINNGATVTGSSCEIFTNGTLRGNGTLGAPLTSSGTVTVSGGTLAVSGNTRLNGTLGFSSLTDRLAVTGSLDLTGILHLPATGLSAGRKLLATCTGTLTPGLISVTTASSAFIPVLDIATPGEVAVNLIDSAAYQSWRSLHFGNTTDPGGQPFVDPDEDGMLNVEEFQAGTDPNLNSSSIPLVWKGGGDNPWDESITPNWLQNATPQVFRTHRATIIDDTGSNTPAIDLLGSLAPGSLTVSNSTKSFTISGGGSLGGAMSMGKSGTATLALATSNSFTGPATIQEGVVNLQHAAALGSAAGGTSVANNARLELQGGITVTGEPLSISGAGGSGFFYGALNSKSGANTWTGPVTIAAAGTRIGAMGGASLAVTGPINSAGQPHGLTIRPFDMTSSVILSGSNTYSGDTVVVGGGLRLGTSNTLPADTRLKLGLSNVSGKLDLDGHHQEVSGLTVSQTSGTFANEITSATPATLNVNQAVALSYSGKITGSVTLSKTGPGTLTLTSSAFLAPGVSVMLDAGALSLASGHTVTALRILGTWQSPGVYTSANSSGLITGAGSLTVTTAGPSGFGPWIDSFPGLSPSDKVPTSDPDADGVNNFLEYVLGGVPDMADTGILPSVTLTPTHFVFSFTRREDSAATTTQIFEYGTSMETWTPVHITAPAGPQVSFGPTSGGLREVSVSIPLNAAPDGRLFGRLSASQP